MRARGMPADPIQRATAVAADYDVLQGLVTFGFGLGLTVMGVTGEPGYGAVIIALGSIFGQRYYFKRYGKVRQSSRRIALTIGSTIIVMPLACIGLIVDVWPRTPVMLGPLTAVVGLVVIGAMSFRHVGVTRTHLAVVGVLALSALLPLTGIVTPEIFWRVDLGVIGLALIVIGAVDHHRLTRAMKPVTDG